MIRSVVISVLLLFGSIHASFASDGRVASLITSDPALEQDLSMEMTLAVLGALQSVSGKKAVPYFQLTRAMGFVNAQKPGACLADNNCLGKIKEQLKIDVLVIGTMEPNKEGGLTVAFHRIESDPLLQFSRTRTVDAGQENLVQNLREMAREMVRPPAPILTTSGPEPFEVFVDGTRVGQGPGTFLVSPGQRNVVLKANGLVILEKTVPCATAGRCSVETTTPKDVQATVKPQIRYIAREQPVRWKRYTGYALSAAGLALVTLGTLDGLEAKNIAQELDDLCQGPVCQLTFAQAQAKEARGQELANRATWFWIGGGAALAGGITFIIVDALTQPKASIVGPEGQERHSRSHFRVTPMADGLWVHHGLSF